MFLELTLDPRRPVTRLGHPPTYERVAVLEARKTVTPLAKEVAAAANPSLQIRRPLSSRD